MIREAEMSNDTGIPIKLCSAYFENNEKCRIELRNYGMLCWAKVDGFFYYIFALSNLCVNSFTNIFSNNNNKNKQKNYHLHYNVMLDFYNGCLVMNKLC